MTLEQQMMKSRKFDDLGNAPIFIPVGSFRVKQPRFKRSRFYLALLVSSVAALAFLTNFLNQKSRQELASYSSTKSMDLSTVRRGWTENEIEHLLTTAKRAWSSASMNGWSGFATKFSVRGLVMRELSISAVGQDRVYCQYLEV